MIMESILTTALEKAVSLGAQYLDEAGKEVAQAKKYNAASCVGFLAAARSAVLGLEDEVDEILIEAGLVARYDWTRKSELHTRIERYLKRDRLRPILDGAQNGIRECYEVAAQDTNGFFQRPAQRELKSEAVKALLQLFGSLSNYTKSLSQKMDWDRVNYAGPSGIGVDELLTLERYLDDSEVVGMDDESRKQSIRKLVETAQDRRQKLGFPLAADVIRVTQKLNVAFRLEAMDHAKQAAASFSSDKRD
jgi:hypothetical protein